MGYGIRGGTRLRPQHVALSVEGDFLRQLLHEFRAFRPWSDQAHVAGQHVPQLRKFIEQSPGEAFPRYALALELKGRGEAEAAVAELQELISRAPDYLAAFLQLGMLLQTCSRPAEAKEVFSRGQELARKKGDSHTLSELTQALDSL